jgi:hypothetical protein
MTDARGYRLARNQALLRAIWTTSCRKVVVEPFYHGRRLLKRTTTAECGQQAKHALWAADGDLGELMLFGARVVGKRIQAARDLNEPAAFD